MKEPKFPKDRVMNNGCLPQASLVVGVCILFFLLVGCGAKKKHIEKKEDAQISEQVIEERIEKKEESENKTSENTQEEKKIEEKKESKEEQIESDYYKRIDPDGTIHEYSNYKNKGKQNVDSKKEERKSDSNKESHESKVIDEKIDKKQDTVDERSSASEKVDVDKKQFDVVTMIWQFVPYILLILAILYLWNKFKISNFIKNLIK